jgi:hypothetical protein
MWCPRIPEGPLRLGAPSFFAPQMERAEISVPRPFGGSSSAQRAGDFEREDSRRNEKRFARYSLGRSWIASQQANRGYCTPSWTTSKSPAFRLANAGFKTLLFQFVSKVPLIYMSEPLSATISPYFCMARKIF